ncbi:hypothetical protein ACFSTC_18955 [Nonomuraea ferruginea]
MAESVIQAASRKSSTSLTNAVPVASWYDLITAPVRRSMTRASPALPPRRRTAARGRRT